MVHRLSDPLADARKLSQSVLAITEMLGLYQAELARVLGWQCGDIGALSSGRRVIEPDSEAWRRAVLLVRCYQALYERTGGDGPAMCHWLRAHNPVLGGSPHLLMVDEDRLAEIVDHLEAGPPP